MSSRYAMEVIIIVGFKEEINKCNFCLPKLKQNGAAF